MTWLKPMAFGVIAQGKRAAMTPILPARAAAEEAAHQGAAVRPAAGVVDADVVEAARGGSVGDQGDDMGAAGGEVVDGGADPRVIGATMATPS
jgi:hypothetical protein